ncbi:hypothetical protein ACE1AN_18635 [Umezakia sp. BLCC-F208]|jgi:hypothetical protein|nr:hypothetical protein [Nostoc sp. RI_552]
MGKLRLEILSDRLLLGTLLLSIGLVLITAISLSFGSVAMTPAQLWLAVIRQGNELNQISQQSPSTPVNSMKATKSTKSTNNIPAL